MANISTDRRARPRSVFAFREMRSVAGASSCFVCLANLTGRFQRRTQSTGMGAHFRAEQHAITRSTAIRTFQQVIAAARSERADLFNQRPHDRHIPLTHVEPGATKGG
jgi:hypothetical protein